MLGNDVNLEGTSAPGNFNYIDPGSGSWSSAVAICRLLGHCNATFGERMLYVFELLTKPRGGLTERF